jgi:hypothetical protein
LDERSKQVKSLKLEPPAGATYTLDQIVWDVDTLRFLLQRMMARFGVGPADLIRAWDTSGDGQLDRHELFGHIRKLLRHVSEEVWSAEIQPVLEAAFVDIDKEVRLGGEFGALASKEWNLMSVSQGAGKIDVMEFERWFRQPPSRSGRAPATAEAGRGRTPFRITLKTPAPAPAPAPDPAKPLKPRRKMEAWGISGRRRRFADEARSERLTQRQQTVASILANMYTSVGGEGNDEVGEGEGEGGGGGTRQDSPASRGGGGDGGDGTRGGTSQSARDSTRGGTSQSARDSTRGGTSQSARGGTRHGSSRGRSRGISRAEALAGLSDPWRSGGLAGELAAVTAARFTPRPPPTAFRDDAGSRPASRMGLPPWKLPKTPCVEPLPSLARSFHRRPRPPPPPPLHPFDNNVDPAAAAEVEGFPAGPDALRSSSVYSSSSSAVPPRRGPLHGRPRYDGIGAGGVQGSSSFSARGPSPFHGAGGVRSTTSRGSYMLLTPSISPRLSPRQLEELTPRGLGRVEMLMASRLASIMVEPPMRTPIAAGSLIDALDGDPATWQD